MEDLGVLTTGFALLLVPLLCLVVRLATSWGVYATLMNVFGDFLTTAVLIGFIYLMFSSPLEALMLYRALRERGHVFVWMS